MAGRVVVWNCVPCGFGVLHQYTRCSSVPLLRRKRAGMLTVRRQLLASCQLDHQHIMALVSGSRQTSFYPLLFQQQSFGKALAPRLLKLDGKSKTVPLNLPASRKTAQPSRPSRPSRLFRRIELARLVTWRAANRVGTDTA
jgi:hypothetical protein